jgi:kynurenine formamidase
MTFRTFRELPRSDHLRLPCAWGIFAQDGGSEELGTLNFLTPSRTRDALEAVTTGERLAVSLPLDAFDPGLFSRSPPRHCVDRIGRNTLDDRLDDFQLQGSTHWDGFLHMAAGGDGYYGGAAEVNAGVHQAFGVHKWSAGIMGRGVLVDVAGYLAEIGSFLPPDRDVEITVELLRTVMEHRGTALPEGSILCIRTGWTELYRARGRRDRERIAHAGRFPGLRADETMAAFLWDSRVAALAVDNPAVEVAPGSHETGSLHRRSLIMTGLPFGELFDFASLGRHCQQVGRWDFLFISVPLQVTGGVGAPANAVAVV